MFLPNNTCLSFSPSVSSSSVVNCSDPGIPANSIRQSKIEHGNFTFGTVVFYDCNPGFYLFGSPVLTCQPTGQWDKPLPECIGESVVTVYGQKRLSDLHTATYTHMWYIGEVLTVENIVTDKAHWEHTADCSVRSLFLPFTELILISSTCSKTLMVRI